MFEFFTVSVLISTLIFTISILVFNLFGFNKRKHYPTGPIGLPILGHLPFFGRYPPDTFSRWRRKYGDVFRIRMGSWETVVVNGYKAIKEAAEQPDDAFSSRPDFTTLNVLQKVNGQTSLAFGPFSDSYLQHRKAVASVLRIFTHRRSEFTEDLISEEAEKLVENLLKKSNGPVDVRSDIQYATGSVIYQVLYGRGMDITKNLDRMVENTKRFIKFTGSGNPCDVMPWLQYVIPWKISTFENMIRRGFEVRMKQIEEHMQAFSAGNVRDITDALLDVDLPESNGTPSTLTRSRLIHSTADLQGAGFDTSNQSLQWIILYMAMYPEVQKRVQSEIDDVIGSGHRVTLKDRSQLVYTEATILEVMRMTSIVPFALPKFTIKDTVLDGYDIDKGTVVFFNLHSVSYDSEIWGDPEIFRPERFIDVNNKLNREKCNHVLSFGLGRRRCVGEFLARMELFLFFANVIRKCQFAKPVGVIYNLEPDPGLVYSPKPFCVNIEERL